MASKLPEQEVVSRTLEQLDRMFGELVPGKLVLCWMTAASIDLLLAVPNK